MTPDAPNPQPPVGYGPCDVREIDLFIRTGDVGSRQAVIHIDTDRDHRELGASIDKLR